MHCRLCITKRHIARYILSLIYRKELSPDLFCNLSYEIYLRPLLSLSEFIANLAGCKSALRTEAQSVEWYILLCLADTTLHLFLVFQYRRFGRYLSEYDLLVFRNILQWFETA